MRSPVYRFRINAEGLEELKRDLESLGPTGEASFERLKQNAPQLANALQKAQDQAGQTRVELEKFGSRSGPVGAIEEVTAAFGRLRGVVGGAVAALGIRELVQFSAEGIRAVDTLDDLAKQYGITAQELQGYRFAAIETNVELQKLEGGFARFTVKIGDAAEGNKAAIEEFQRLGVKLLDAEGDLRPFNDILIETANGLNAIEDSARRAALASDLFGRQAAADLNKLLGGGGGRLQALLEMAPAAAELTEEQIRLANEATKALDRLAFAWTNFTNNLALQTAPVLTDTATGLTAVIEDTELAATAMNVLHQALSPVTAAFAQLNGLSRTFGDLWSDTFGGATTDPLSGSQFFTDLPLQGLRANEAAEAANVRATGAPHFASNTLWDFGAETTGSGDPIATSDLDNVAQSAREAKQALAELGQASGALDTIIGKFASQDLSKEVKAWVDLGDATDRYREAILQLEVEIEAGGLVEEDLADAREEQAEITERLVAAEEARAAAIDAMREAGEDEIQTLNDRADELAFNNEILRLELIGTSEARAAIAELTRERKLELLEAERAAIVKEKLAEISALEAEGNLENAEAIAILRQQLEDTNSAYDTIIGRTAVNESLGAAKAEMERRREEMMLPFENFLEGVQDVYTDFWEDVLDGNIDSWEDAFDSVKSLAKRFAAEMLSLLTIEPVIKWSQELLEGTASDGGQTGGSGGTGGSVFGKFGDILTSFGDMFGMGGGSGGSGAVSGSSTGGLAKSTAGKSGGGGGMFGFLGDFGGMLGGGGSGAVSGSSTGGNATAAGGSSGFGGMGSMLGYGGAVATVLSSDNWFEAGGSAIGGVIGGYFGGGQGAAIGASIGSMVGSVAHSMFGKQPESPRATTPVMSEDGMLAIGETRTKAGAETEATEPLTEKAVDLFNDILKGLGAEINLPKGPLSENPLDFGLMMRGENGGFHSFVYGVDMPKVKGTSEEQAEAAFNDFVIRLFKEGAERRDITGLSDAMKTVLENSIAKTVEDFAVDLDVAKLYDSMTSTESLTQSEQAIEALTDQFVNLRKEAARLGLDLEPVAEAFNRARRALTEGFNDAVADQILGFENPLALAFRELKRAQDEQRREAVALGADLVQLEKLHALQREQVVEQALRSSLAGIGDFVERALLGPLSTLSPEQKLFEAKRQYNEVAAAAMAGDPEALQKFAGVGNEYLAIARDFFASSRPYSEIFDSVLNTARGLGDADAFVLNAQAQAAGNGTGTGFTYPNYELPPMAAPATPAVDTAAAVENSMRRRIEQSERQHGEVVHELRGLRRDVGDLVQEQRLTGRERASGGGH